MASSKKTRAGLGVDVHDGQFVDDGPKWSWMAASDDDDEVHEDQADRRKRV